MPIKDVSGQTLQQLVSLAGKAAVVTGAGRGIGLAIARRLTEAGADVVIGDVDVPAAEASAAALSREFGRRVIGVSLNVAEESSIVALADRAVAEFGRLDIWVNNAGIFPGSPTIDQTVEIWDRVQDINLRGAFVGAREAAKRMMSQTTKDGAPKGGVIVNVASVSGFSGRPGLAAYVASKHGVVGLTKSLGVEWGPHGIRVLGLAPTGVSTPGVRERKAEATGAERERIEALEKTVGAALPLGRLGVPDDIARVALFCASDLSMLMTGSTLLVDAGALAN
jgi:NAD(P)-dependent dehydrogenase (short-subunit alcohol dehydrogenase family)